MSPKNNQRNHNQPTRKHSSYKAKKQRQSRTRIASPSIATNAYHCSSCDSIVTKRKRCGGHITRMGKRLVTEYTGLGRFKCVCGNKTVRVVKIKPADNVVTMPAPARKNFPPAKKTWTPHRGMPKAA